MSKKDDPTFCGAGTRGRENQKNKKKKTIK
jgi:hypothetical protein